MTSDGGGDYNPRDYPAVAVTVDVALFAIRDDELHILLIQRGVEPFAGAWALPGGFIQAGEDLDAAAARELAEETGVTEDAIYLEQLRTYGSPGRDPRMRVVTVAYWGACASLPAPLGSTDAAHAELVEVSQVEAGEIKLAFDHEAIVRDALERVRAKLEYTALAARFCPPEFTISELRRVYETVWNTRLDPGNFQRKVRENRSFRQVGQSTPTSRSIYQSAGPAQRMNVNRVEQAPFRTRQILARLQRTGCPKRHALSGPDERGSAAAGRLRCGLPLIPISRSIPRSRGDGRPGMPDQRCNEAGSGPIRALRAGRQARGKRLSGHCRQPRADRRGAIAVACRPPPSRPGMQRWIGKRRLALGTRLGPVLQLIYP